jgi:DNA polymerase-3 subunit gamma/tau
MSSPYLALARKYRPQRFEDIVGEDHVTTTLQRALASGRVHHAYLFTGIRGIGKTTCARVLAKALNCHRGPADNPCNECVSCVEITAGRSMDVMEIDAASNRGIDDIRELREGVRYTTARDKYKIVIIDEVHMLTDQAFNALLKTLEEPPPHVRFILATTDPQKMPATILSRCQRFDFRRVTTSAMVAHLKDICQREGVNVEDEALSIVVRQTEGSVRDCMSLLDQLLAAAQGNLTAVGTREILGVADRRWVLGTIDALLKGDPMGGLKVLREVYLSGHDVMLFFGELVRGFRDAMVLSVAGGDPELLEMTESEIHELKGLIGGRNPLDLQYYLSTILKSVDEMKGSEFPLFAAEEALVRVASAGQTVPLGRLVQRVGRLQKHLQALAETGMLDITLLDPAAPEEASSSSLARQAAAEDVLPLPLPPTPPAGLPEDPSSSSGSVNAEPDSSRGTVDDKPDSSSADVIVEPASPPASVNEEPVAHLVLLESDGSGLMDVSDMGNWLEWWTGFVGFLEGKRMVLDARNVGGMVPLGWDGAVLTVQVPRRITKVLSASDVSKWFSQYCGSRKVIQFEEVNARLLEQSPVGMTQARQASDDRKKKEQLLNEQATQEVVTAFPGTSVSVELESSETNPESTAP